MCFDHIQLPQYLPQPLPLPCPPNFVSFWFFTHQFQFVLSIYSQVCGLPLECVNLSRALLFKKTDFPSPASISCQYFLDRGGGGTLHALLSMPGFGLA